MPAAACHPAPAAARCTQIRLAAELAASPRNTHNDAFRYLTHSWLLSLFFDCPNGMGFRCPNATLLSDVRRAVRAGTITWHAAPFNPQYEVVGRVRCVLYALGALGVHCACGCSTRCSSSSSG